jgi:uncharacterized protein
VGGSSLAGTGELVSWVVVVAAVLASGAGFGEGRRMTRSRLPSDPESRRAFLQKTFAGLGVLAVGPTLFSSCGDDGGGENCTAVPGTGEPNPTTSNIANLGALQGPDENGLMLPAGFTSRIIARSGEVVACSSYVWHGAPDGGATFPTEDGGWIYVSNAEIRVLIANGALGGVGAIRFDAAGNIVDAYSILDGSDTNCAGGPTPWGTWISCEEIPTGHSFECDPTGVLPARMLPALGTFQHEAVAIDPDNFYTYLTEDVGSSCLYRFRPAEGTISNGRTSFNEGVLEVARFTDAEGGTLTEFTEESTVILAWDPVPEPNPADPVGVTSSATRNQVADAARFDGGEGIWFHEGIVYFTTKGDNRLWALEVATNILTLVYTLDHAGDILDNVTVSSAGDVIVAHDGGPLQIVVVTAEGEAIPLVQITGQPGTEITGPAFDPSHTRLYFSSQRGQETGGLFNSGITYCVEGPFYV